MLTRWGSRGRALGLAALLAVGLAACDGGDEERTGGDEAAGSAGTADRDGVPEAAGTQFAEGREVYRRCVACHVATATENKVGPHLVGLFGRPAGAVDDFRYSQAMRESDLVWTEETLSAYLRDPRRYIPGNRMAFAGIRQQDDLDALLAYLQVVTAPD